MPQIVATEEPLNFFDGNVRLRGNMAKNHSQPLAEWPASRDDYTWRTRTFTGELALNIGGEDFVLRQRAGKPTTSSMCGFQAARCLPPPTTTRASCQTPATASADCCRGY